MILSTSELYYLLFSKNFICATKSRLWYFFGW